MAEGPSKKKGLGRGLSHLFGEAEAAYRPQAAEVAKEASAPAPTATLPIEHLAPGRFQPRRHFDPGALEELSASIRQHGLLQPILVRPLPGEANRYEIIAGERRWRASQLAALHEVPVIVQEMSDTQALEIALVENLQRQDLTALEEAEGYQRLMDEFQHSQARLGELVGKSRSHIANMLRLLGLPQPVKSMVQDGVLTAGHARALLTATDPVGLAKTVVQRNLSVRETERLANLAREANTSGAAEVVRPAKSTSAPKHSDLIALERDLAERLGLRVTINVQGSGGSLTITYRSLDQLDQIIEKLS